MPAHLLPFRPGQPGRTPEPGCAPRRAWLATTVLLGATVGLSLAAGCSRLSAAGRLWRPQARFEVVMVNGGGRPAGNYLSHLLHVRQLLAVLRASGVPATDVTVFGADGSDPEADLAVRDLQPERDFWLLQGTRLEGPLRTQIRYENSQLEGVTLRPATRAALGEWFAGATTRLGAGDTLLFYVTDHGTKNPADTRNNFITLWGEKETLSVQELAAFLSELAPGVRVVTLMSQCYSGAFAELMYAGTDSTVPRGTVCGFFASTADRPAYGCYPENRDKDNVGHSFRFIEGLAAGYDFPAAHAHTLVSDRTPDVPLRTSDVYLEHLLEDAAGARGVALDGYIDELLDRAWQNKAAWEPEIRLLDRIGQAFGYFSPRSVAELKDQAKLLPDISQQFRSYGNAWKLAQGDLAAANLERFVTDEPVWRERIGTDGLDSLDAEARHGLARDLLAELAVHTRNDTATASRLVFLRERAESTAAARYRMQVRLGVVLRMQGVLTSIAGRVHLASEATDGEREAHAALLRCQDLVLENSDMPETLPTEREPFPSYEDELTLAERSLPGWMGVRFRQASPQVRKRFALADGAAAVVTVYPDSPAKKAGLDVGDIILGPPGRPFTEPHQIREWVMTAAVGTAAPIDVLHQERVRRVALVPDRYPLKWPSLPGPPKIGSTAPTVGPLSAYRGALPPQLAGGGPFMLFFWATWCAPCKASLPELVAFERERRIPVVAITDERSEQLDAFFERHDGPFPRTVAMDEYRRSFLAYGVSGTPAFVLVDEGGRVTTYSVGYRANVGLPIDGWSWAGRTAAAGDG